MRNAETVLNVIRDRGKRALPLEDLYRQLFNPALYLRAYSRIYRNAGAMTPGVTQETADGMSMEKISALIAEIRAERFRWTPVRRTYIAKKNGKQRPLGIPTWKDKLLQEVIRSLLEAYYEPQFSDHSHGFRPERGCHTALTTIAHVWKGTKWFIEGDIKGCFDHVDHSVLLAILGEKVQDNRFLRLIANLLQAGYLEEWCYRPTMSGTPQGGIVSPILANIYLDRLDRFVEERLLPQHTRGSKREKNPEYHQLNGRIYYYRKVGKVAMVRRLVQERRRLPSVDPTDPAYRRLRYLRYADDFLLGFAGPKAEAEMIKEQLATFLREELKLELSQEKTVITHATTQAARFLGYELISQQNDTWLDGRNSRNVNGAIGLRLPSDVVRNRCARYQHQGKARHRPELEPESDFTIVHRYQSEYRGYVEYYSLAQNIAWLDQLRWVMETSLLKTLAGKYRTSVVKMAREYGATVQTEHGPRKCLAVTVMRDGKPALIARFGGVPLRRKEGAVLRDRPTTPRPPERSELIQRLLADECEICRNTEQVEVHHVRKLADLEPKGRREKPLWVRIMAARRRKTLILCRECHEALHAGRPLRSPSTA